MKDIVRSTAVGGRTVSVYYGLCQFMSDWCQSWTVYSSVVPRWSMYHGVVQRRMHVRTPLQCGIGLPKAVRIDVQSLVYGRCTTSVHLHVLVGSGRQGLVYHGVLSLVVGSKSSNPVTVWSVSLDEDQACRITLVFWP